MPIATSYRPKGISRTAVAFAPKRSTHAFFSAITASARAISASLRSRMVTFARANAE